LEATDGSSTPAALRAASPDELLAAADRQDVDFLSAGLAFKPVVDGYVLPTGATDAFAAGRRMDVPLLIGSNADEGETFVSQMGSPTPAQYRTYLRASFGRYADEVFALFPARTRLQVLPALSRLLTEIGFAGTARFAAASMTDPASSAEEPAQSGTAYLYQFTRVPPEAAGTAFPRGAFHGLEIAYAFGRLKGFGVTNERDLELSRQIMALWTRFAATGDPNEAATGQTRAGETGAGETGGAGTGPTAAGPAAVPRWPAYDPVGGRYLELGDQVRARAHLYEEACDLADEIRLQD